MYKALICTLALAACLPAGQAAETSPPAASSAPVYQAPTVTSRPELEWPGRSDREALVMVRLTIDKEGKAVDVETMDSENGFHEPRFVRAAEAMVRGMRFKPATLDGEPVEVTVIQPVTFGLGKVIDQESQSTWVTGISDPFRVELKKVDDLLKKRDYSGADFHAQWMLKEKVKFGYEFAVLKAQLAETHAALGHFYRALRLAEEATKRTTSPEAFSLHAPIPANRASSYLLPKNVVLQLLDMRMRLAADLGMLREAMEAWRELAGFEALPATDPRAILAASITAKLQGAEPLPMRVRLDADVRSWQHKLYRRKFTFEKVQGDINNLTLTCGRDRQGLEYAPGEEWELPAGWENCSVSIGGTEETSFYFIELAD